MAEDDKKDDKDDETPAEGAEGLEEEAKRKSKKKMMILIGAGTFLVLAIGIGAAAFFMHGAKEADPEKQIDVAADKDKKGAPVYFTLGDQLVNLSGEGKHPNFLKVKISLELADEKDLPLMDALKPRIIDNFQVYLRELRIDDLRGSAGMYRLREELLMRVTEAAAPVRIRDVLFQEMLVQ